MKFTKLLTIFLSIIFLLTCFSACSQPADNGGGENENIIPDTALTFQLKDKSLPVTVKTKGVNAKLYINGILSGDVYQVKEHKVILSADEFASFKGKVLDVRLDFMDNESNLVNSQSLTIDVADRVISTAQDFDAWYSDYMAYAEKPADNQHLKGVTSEYIVLTADITLSKAYNNWTMAGWLSHLFTGTFDGRGHIIYGFSSSNGFIPNVGKTGVIKNLALVDMTTTGDNGFLGMFLCGTIENCYFQGEHTTTNPKNYSGFYYRYYNDQANPRYYVQKVSNVVVCLERKDFAISYDALFNNVKDLDELNTIFGLPDVSTFNNFYMILENCNGKAFNSKNGEGWDISLFDNIWNFSNDVTELPEGFSSDYWEISDDGLRFKGIKD